MPLLPGARDVGPFADGSDGVRRTSTTKVREERLLLFIACCILYHRLLFAVLRVLLHLRVFALRNNTSAPILIFTTCACSRSTARPLCYISFSAHHGWWPDNWNIMSQSDSECRSYWVTVSPVSAWCIAAVKFMLLLSPWHETDGDLHSCRRGVPCAAKRLVGCLLAVKRSRRNLFEGCCQK